MSQVDELLQTIAASPVKTAGAAGSEGHIAIGMDRFIIVPDELKKIGVQFDHNIETVTFDCLRYWDENDMSTMKIYINYMRNDGHVGMHLCSNVVAEDNVMHFDWTVSGDVTAVEGYLTFLVCIKKTDADGNEANHWNSEINNEMYISKGLKCQETVVRRFPDIITQLLTRMDEVEVEQQRWENATEADIVAWKNAAYKDLDDRMKVAEGNTTPEEILNRVHEAIASDETVHQILEETTNEYVQSNEIIAETVEKTNEAISIAKGANLAISYTTYEEMVSVLNSLSVEKFNPGQNIYIATVGVPDLFVYAKEETSVEYTYVDDQSIVDEMMANVFIQVGHYKLAQLETQNVDIRDVVVPLLVEDWVEDEDGGFVQTVDVEGLGAGNNPVITLYSLAEEISDEEWAAYTLITDVNVEQGQITFIAIEKPEITFTVIAKSVTAASGTEVALDGLIKKVDAIETSLTDIAIPLLVSDWVLDEATSTYSQDITINGLGGDSVPLVALSSVGDIATEEEIEAYACISDVVTSENTMTFIASELPKISFTVVAKGVVAAENSSVADITALVGRVSELEEANATLKSNIDSMHKLSAIGMTTENTIYEIIQAMDINTSMSFEVSNSTGSPLNQSLPTKRASTVTIVKNNSNRATLLLLGIADVVLYYGKAYNDLNTIHWYELPTKRNLEYHVGDTFVFENTLVGISNSNGVSVAFPIYLDKPIGSDVTSCEIVINKASWFRGNGKAYDNAKFTLENSSILFNVGSTSVNFSFLFADNILGGMTSCFFNGKITLTFK